MSTMKNKKAAIVGIFILGGLALLVTIILVMGGQRKSFAKTITVSAIFDDVSGLQQGNNIWLAGVKVGTVKKIAFNPDSKIMVSMNILSSMQPYIHKDATAKISSESLIGNKIVVLSGGTAQAPLIQSGDILAIKTSINTEDMMTTLQENNKNLLAITTDLKNLSEGLAAGKGSIGKLLHDETLVNTLQKTMNTLNAAVVNAREFTEDFSNYSAKLQTKGTLTNELITDTIVFDQLRSTVMQLQQIVQSGQAVVNNLNKASSGLSSTTSPIGVMLNDPEAAADLKSTLNNLNTGTKKLDENLEALQHNFLLRGFFRKKAKTRTDSLNRAAKL